MPAKYEELYDINEIPDINSPGWENSLEAHLFPNAHIYEHPHQKIWAKKTEEQRKLTTLRYYALCSFVDDMFGKVLNKLEQIGELENSFVIFVSDHGEMLGQMQYRFSKYCLYDGSVRVPLIIAGPQIPEKQRGTVDDRPAELVDIVPTILDITGSAEMPELPGRSLLKPPCRKGCFSEYHGGGGEQIQLPPTYMWRTREWKLILYLPCADITDAMLSVDNVRGELYHLTDDPNEWNNLYFDEGCRDIREELTRELLMHLACVWAKYPRKPAKNRLA